jgi:hypothetical protein
LPQQRVALDVARYPDAVLDLEQLRFGEDYAFIHGAQFPQGRFVVPAIVSKNPRDERGAGI